MRNLKIMVVVGLVAFAAMVLGCGDDGESGDPGAIPGAIPGVGANASATPDPDRACRLRGLRHEEDGVRRDVNGLT